MSRLKRICLCFVTFAFFATVFYAADDFSEESLARDAELNQTIKITVDMVESGEVEDILNAAEELFDAMQERAEQGESSVYILPEGLDALSGAAPQKNEGSFTGDRYPEDVSSVEVQIPSSRRPKKPDSKKLEQAKTKDEDNSEFEENTMTLSYGTPAEITKVVDSVVESDDVRYTDALYDLFQETASNDVREKILGYFGSLKDPCLSDYAVEILDDPYDTPQSLVQKCMTYVSDVECHEAAPALIKLVDSDEDKYFTGALTALGTTGGPKEALFLASYLERDDLDTPKRQALMRTLGKMNAEETYDSLVEIAQNEDENSFVRMYAAEAIGNMKKDEAIPILIDMYENGDPNMREYCIKGLQNFPKNDKAKKAIMQGIRDDHYKVRIQAIKSAKEMNLTEATDFLVFRAKNDSEKAVKKECYAAIAELDTKKGNEYLVSVITDKKAADSAKTLAAEALLKKEGKTGTKEIAELAESIASDDKRKPLRYSLGKLLAKYPDPAFTSACTEYIKSKDAQTAAVGIDMYKSGRYSAATPELQLLAEDKTRNSVNRKRARKLLGLEEDDGGSAAGSGKKAAVGEGSGSVGTKAAAGEESRGSGVKPAVGEPGGGGGNSTADAK